MVTFSMIVLGVLMTLSLAVVVPTHLPESTRLKPHTAVRFWVLWLVVMSYGACMSYLGGQAYVHGFEQEILRQAAEGGG